ncbi:MAG: glutaredoxin [Bacilli bacterium]|nr:glutaredoxin [Bacilli bacterium]
MRVFILKNCPHCIRARGYISQLKEEDLKYQSIDIEYIDEAEEVELADAYDYYYVPSFFDGNKKLHEGTISKNEVKRLFDEFLGGKL